MVSKLIILEAMYASAQFYYIVRLPVYVQWDGVQWDGILWHASQIYMYMHLWWNQSRVAL